MQLIQNNSSRELKKCETVIHIFKYRKGQTYKQIKLAKKENISFYLFQFSKSQ